MAIQKLSIIDLIANDRAGKESRVLLYLKVSDVNEYVLAFSRD